MDKYAFMAIFGAAVAALLGGWDGAMLTLCVFMLIDYISGVVLAAVFKKSSKTPSGTLESRAGLKGLCRKVGMLLMVIVAVRLDIMCNLGGVLRTGVIFALVANESISIVENLGLMGLPLPKPLVSAIEQLHGKSEKSKEDDSDGSNV